MKRKHEIKTSGFINITKTSRLVKFLEQSIHAIPIEDLFNERTASFRRSIQDP